MIQNELMRRILPHVSSLTLALLVTAAYVLGDHDWLNEYLPINGKPLVIFLLVGLVLVYELSITGQRRITKQVCSIDSQVKNVLVQMEINRLIQAVNGLYGRFITSGDEFIDNEYTIKELSELIDMRSRLDINSYTEGRLNFLTSKISRVKS